MFVLPSTVLRLRPIQYRDLLLARADASAQPSSLRLWYGHDSSALASWRSQAERGFRSRSRRSAGAYLHEAEPPGFYEIVVERGFADAEPRQYLALSQNSLADHGMATSARTATRAVISALLRPGWRACKRHKNKGVALIAKKPLPYFGGRLLMRVMRCFKASSRPEPSCRKKFQVTETT